MIEIAPQIVVPDIPAGSSNKRPNNLWGYDDGDDEMLLYAIESAEDAGFCGNEGKIFCLLLYDL